MINFVECAISRCEMTKLVWPEYREGIVRQTFWLENFLPSLSYKTKWWKRRIWFWSDCKHLRLEEDDGSDEDDYQPVEDTDNVCVILSIRVRAENVVKTYEVKDYVLNIGHSNGNGWHATMSSY